MPYHIKKTSVLGNAVPVDGTEYYAGDNKWTNVYENRKVYANESDANAQKATTISRTIGDKTYTYTPSWFKNSTVVEE
tara:strand:+ start:766 stop:999 length:234 start_codon:yes stop_codon:yes gene_type:complete